MVTREGIYGYLSLTHVDVRQKPAQYCNYPPIKKISKKKSKFHGQRSMVGYSPWDDKELDMPEQTHTHVLYRKVMKDLDDLGPFTENDLRAGIISYIFGHL